MRCFTKIARRYTEQRLLPEKGFVFDLAELDIPDGATLAVIVNPNNPNGGTFDMALLPGLLRRHPKTLFLADEAFIGLAGQSVAPLMPEHANLLVTHTLSKAHSLVGYAGLSEPAPDPRRHTFVRAPRCGARSTPSPRRSACWCTWAPRTSIPRQSTSANPVPGSLLARGW